MNHSSGRSVIGIISRSGCAEERGLEARAADGGEERAGQTDLDESPAAVEVLLCVTTDPARTRVGLVACGWRLDAYRRAITPVSPPMHRAMPIVNSAPTLLGPRALRMVGMGSQGEVAAPPATATVANPTTKAAIKRIWATRQKKHDRRWPPGFHSARRATK
jgi:hypothetical protein